MIGNNYKRKSTYHGSYQGNFLKLVTALYLDRRRVLHLFAGMVDTDTFPHARHPP